MIEFKGKYTTAKVWIDQIDKVTTAQITEFINHPAFTNPVAIMPDTHAGAGSVIGFTMPLGDKVIPNTIGVDIGCGMLSMDLESKLGTDLEDLDKKIRDIIPFGFEVREKPFYDMERSFPWGNASLQNVDFVKKFVAKFKIPMDPTFYSYQWFEKKCEQIRMNVSRAVKSLGTLGGGNHFIELGVSKKTGTTWVTIHSGSRQFGEKVCRYWQKYPAMVERQRRQKDFESRLPLLRELFKDKPKQIPSEIKLLRSKLGLNKKSGGPLEYLEGDAMKGYLTDMVFAQAYAAANRHIILNQILTLLDPIIGWRKNTPVHTIHNYIDFNDFIIRKGAISAHKDELMVIPFNMEDGILLCKGKGNEEWNCSAPHGAGRIKSRSQAKKDCSAEIAQQRMTEKGIYVSAVPVDEVKEAYKDPKIIEEAIAPTAEVVDRIVPVMNLKAV